MTKLPVESFDNSQDATSLPEKSCSSSKLSSKKVVSFRDPQEATASLNNSVSSSESTTDTFFSASSEVSISDTSVELTSDSKLSLDLDLLPVLLSTFSADSDNSSSSDISYEVLDIEDSAETDVSVELPDLTDDLSDSSVSDKSVEFLNLKNLEDFEESLDLKYSDEFEEPRKSEEIEGAVKAEKLEEPNEPEELEKSEIDDYTAFSDISYEGFGVEDSVESDVSVELPDLTDDLSELSVSDKSVEFVSFDEFDQFKESENPEYFEELEEAGELGESEEIVGINKSEKYSDLEHSESAEQLKKSEELNESKPLEKLGESEEHEKSKEIKGIVEAEKLEEFNESKESEKFEKDDCEAFSDISYEVLDIEDSAEADVSVELSESIGSLDDLSVSDKSVEFIRLDESDKSEDFEKPEYFEELEEAEVLSKSEELIGVEGQLEKLEQSEETKKLEEFAPQKKAEESSELEESKKSEKDDYAAFSDTSYEVLYDNDEVVTAEEDSSTLATSSESSSALIITADPLNTTYTLIDNTTEKSESKVLDIANVTIEYITSKKSVKFQIDELLEKITPILGSPIIPHVEVEEEIVSRTDFLYEDKYLADFEGIIKYQFHDKSLLKKALTHSSSTSDKNLDNERLEFFGDAVLDLVIREYLYHRYPNHQEGELTEFKSSLVCKSSLSKAAKRLSVSRFMRFGKGISKRKTIPDSLQANAFEAISAAIYLDSGYDAAKHFILSSLADFMDTTISKAQSHNYKSTLQKFVQREHKEVPLYKIIKSTGPEHARSFTVAVYFNNTEYGRGNGPSKKVAEQAAAAEALSKLPNNGM